MSASAGTRRRLLDFFHGTSLYVEDTDPIGTAPAVHTEQRGDYQITGKQETTSWDSLYPLLRREIRRISQDSSNLPPGTLQRLKRLDMGSQFLTYRHSYSHSHPWVKVGPVKAGLTTRTYSGPIFAKSALVNQNASLWPVTTSLPNLDGLITARGSTAIARVLPTNPVANAAQFLGELREELPSVPGSHLVNRNHSLTKRGSDIGHEYLNIEFGIKPMLSDFMKFGQAIRTSNRVLDQLRRDSGRLVRRRYAFPLEITTEKTVIGSATCAPSLNTYLFDGNQSSGQLEKTRVTTRRFSFSGAFTYHYSDRPGLLGNLRRAEQDANKLFGIRVTPETIWELTPWSWAVDWVANYGDVIHNLSAFANDGLVMAYGYAMCHETISDTYTLSGLQLKGHNPTTLTQTFTSEVKRRIKATPFGFGLDPASFSARQWAILAALGLSRGSYTI